MPQQPLTPYCTPDDVVNCCVWPQFEQLPGPSRTRLINTASYRVNQYCRRPFGFVQQSVIEVFSGRNGSALWLTLRPVISIMSIAQNGEPLDNTYQSAWTFDPDKGKVVRGNGQDGARFGPYWTAGTDNIAVTYWGGYNPIPDDIVTATAFLVRYLYNQGRQAGVYASESIGDYRYQLREQPVSSTMPSHVADLLAGYVQDDVFA